MAPWEVHPALVHFPLALFVSALVVDLAAWFKPREGWLRVSYGLLVAGLGTGVVAAAFGLLAYYTVPAHTDEAHRVMYWHGGMAAASLAVFGAAVLARRNAPSQPSALARLLVIVGGVFITATGWAGGYLVFQGAAGVNPQLLSEALQSHEHGQSGAGKSSGKPGEQSHGQGSRQAEQSSAGQGHGSQPSETARESERAGGHSHGEQTVSSPPASGRTMTAPAGHQHGSGEAPAHKSKTGGAAKESAAPAEPGSGDGQSMAGMTHGQGGGQSMAGMTHGQGGGQSMAGMQHGQASTPKGGRIEAAAGATVIKDPLRPGPPVSDPVFRPVLAEPTAPAPPGHEDHDHWR